jgi:exosortase
MSDSEIQSSDAPTRLWWVPFLILAAAHLPLVWIDFTTTWPRAHYQFFPFAFVAFGYLLWARQHSYNPRPKLILTLIVLDLLMLLAAALIKSPWLASVALWHLLLAVAVSRKDKATGSSLAYLALLPLLAVRLPANTDFLVIQHLQDFTSRVASKVLNFVGCLHLRDGNVITLPSKTLMVEEACSGIQSLFTLIFLAVLICCYNRRRAFHAILVIASGVFFAGVMNVCRVISIALAEDWWQMDLTAGWSHDLLGYAVLGLAAGLLYNFDFFLLGFTERVPYGGGNELETDYRNPVIAAFNWLFSTKTRHTPRGLSSDDPGPPLPFKKAILISSVLCGIGIAAQAPVLLFAPVQVNNVLTNLDLLNESSLEPEMAGFVRQAYDTSERDRNSVEGQFSNSWVFKNDNLTAHVSCDHLFCGWHDLRVCYTGIGWEVAETQLDRTESEWHVMQVRLTKPNRGSYGLLLFSGFTPTGTPVQPPDMNAPTGLFQYRLTRNGGLYNTAPDTIQCQTFVESPFPFGDDQIKTLRQLHLKTRRQIRDAALAKASVSQLTHD